MYCEPLRSKVINKKLIQNFFIEREKEYSDPAKNQGQIIGLEAYLKYCAWEDDQRNNIKAYVIKTYFTNEIIAYFTLKCGMFSLDNDTRNELKEELAKEKGIKLVPDTIPCVEIAQYAVNDNYKIKHGKNGSPLKGLGVALYPDFIYPIIRRAAKIIGIKCIYLYAAGDEHLTDYYERVFGFKKSNDKKLIPIMPYYDNGCSFMYYTLKD